MPKKVEDKLKQQSEKFWSLRILFLFIFSLFLISINDWIGVHLSFFAGTSKTIGLSMFGVVSTIYIYKKFGGEPLIRDLHRLIRNIEIANQAEEIGLSRIYRSRTEAKGDIINDVENASESIILLSAIYHSEYIKESVNEEFVQALVKASQNANTRNNKLHLEYLSLAPGDKSTPADSRSTLISLWAKKENKSTDEVYKQIVRGSEEFNRLVANVQQKTNHIIDARRCFLVDYLAPHALIIIDNKIVYLSPYDYFHVRGEMSLTMRLTNGKWAQVILNEYERLKKDSFFEYSRVLGK